MIYQISRILRKHGPLILSCLAAAGTVATAIIAVKATPMANELLENAREEKSEELSKLEVVVAVAPAYIPAAAMCVSTIMCIFGANALNARQQAIMVSAYNMLGQTYKEYRNKVIERYGEDTDRDMCMSIAKERGCTNGQDDEWSDLKRTYCLDISVNDENHMKFFEKTKEEIAEAFYGFNRNFAIRGECPVNELYTFLDLPETEKGNELSWSMAGGYSFVDFGERTYRLDDGMEVTNIYALFVPGSEDNW